MFCSKRIPDMRKIVFFNFTMFLLVSICFCSSMSSNVYAQRDPPVRLSYLSSLTLSPNGVDDWFSHSIEMHYRQEGGPGEHTERQMYLVAYLEKDEEEILKIASDKTWLNKHGPPEEKLFLDVLIQKKLVTILDSQSVQQTQRAEYLKVGTNTYCYEFHFSNATVVKAIQKLGNYKSDKSELKKSYGNKFKLLGFVPVNDCKYATKVGPKVKGVFDFSHRQDPEGFSHLNTPILYFKPLPYVFQYLYHPDSDSIRIFVH